MKTIILFTVLAVARADKRCRGINLGDRYYNLDILKDGINHLHDLAIKNQDSALYFTFEDLTNVPARFLGCFDMNSHNATVIDGIRNATAIAIDPKTGKTFVGGADGLFKINERRIPERLPIVDDIQYMHFKDDLYFTNKRKEAYKFVDGKAILLNELRGLEVERLIVDNDNNIFYTNNKELFRIKLGTRAVNTHEEHKADCLATDLYYKPYICTKNGLYSYNKYKYVFDKESDNLKNLKAITFNRVNEPIYAVYDLLIKLSLSEIPCFED
ncbi:uncharacterized protein LOC121738006 [Aricia agestis]|uniref:uncharacterized protein LOC121738006 n=1 Tax=Aricia agestis TaxID=91739 RepID=UPI001C209E3B|nr:uncharacterized protein LOC121738006 [Aricia agestis]